MGSDSGPGKWKLSDGGSRGVLDDTADNDDILPQHACLLLVCHLDGHSATKTAHKPPPLPKGPKGLTDSSTMDCCESPHKRKRKPALRPPTPWELPTKLNQGYARGVRGVCAEVCAEWAALCSGRLGSKHGNISAVSGNTEWPSLHGLQRHRDVLLEVDDPDWESPNT